MRRLPAALWLYDAGRVTLDDARARAAAPTEGDLYSRARTVLLADGVLGLSGANADALSLLDFHVLVACLLHAEVLHEAEAQLRCHNCGEERAVDAASRFEWGPFVDHELDADELDSVDTRPHTLPLHARRRRLRVRLEPRTLGDVAPLLSTEGAGFSRRGITRFVLDTLGIVAVAPARPLEVLRAIHRLGPRTTAALAEAWHRAHLTARLSASHTCTCGASLIVRVPRATLMDRLGREERPRALAPPPDFPDLLAFEKLVRAAKREAYRAHAIGDLRLIVDDGVPAVDDAGVPLLGSYLPPSLDGQERGEIRLYYLSFRDEAALDPSFDVEGEIHETVEHEVEHHLSFLRGEDPVDDEERWVIAKERQQTVGKSELARRDEASLLRFVSAWPVLLIVVLVAAVGRCFG